MVFALDHRLALVLYVLLLLAAAAPVVIGWLRLLPPEREPFTSSGETSREEDGDVFAVFLLANITLSLLLRIPGINYPDALSVPLAKWISPEWANHVVMVGFIWFGFIGGLAAAYSLIRKNPLRWPLVFGGAFTLLLSLASSALLGSIRGAE
jgi:hypothetical protein